MTTGLRVAHVLRKFDAAALGGTETHVAEVTRRLEQRGVHCEVHAPLGPTSHGGLDVPLLRYRAFCPFVGPAEKRRALWANAGNLASIDEPIRLLRDRGLSLAHLHTTGRIGGAVRTAMRLTGRPYLLSVHGPLLSGGTFLAQDTERRLSGVVDLGRPLGLIFGARRVLDDAARVICFNDEEHAALSARIGDRAVRMDHGVDVPRLRSGDAARARSRWPRLGAAQIVLHLGRLCGQKDQLLSVRAFAAGAPDDAQLVLAGPETDRGYLANLEREARLLGVWDRVLVLGNVGSADVADLFAAATVCLLPSQHEAFGLVALESWAAGRATLFARVGGLADLAKQLGPGAPALADRDPRPWAVALAALLSQPSLRQEAAERGAKLLAARFSWDVVAAGLEALYREVLDERARRAA